MGKDRRSMMVAAMRFENTSSAVLIVFIPTDLLQTEGQFTSSAYPLHSSSEPGMVQTQEVYVYDGLKRYCSITLDSEREKNDMSFQRGQHAHELSVVT